MKLLIVLLTLTFSFSVNAAKCKTDPTKPHHCHEPVPAVVKHETKMKYDPKDHFLISLTVSTMVFGAMNDAGFGAQKSYFAAVGTSLLLATIMESDRKSRDRALQASLGGSLLAPVLMYKF